MHIVEATIDDANPQVLAAFLETALGLGAIDAYLTPVVMKKNRLGTKLTLLAAEDNLDPLIAAVFRETTSIGIRHFPVGRRALDRALIPVRVLGGTIGVKVASFGGEPVNAQPEFADALALARKRGLPVKEVLRRALAAYERKE